VTVGSIKPNSANGYLAEMVLEVVQQAMNQLHTAWDRVDLVQDTLVSVAELTNHQ
jgi:DNA-directed RNA polymerase specialized sigma24 family protein